MLAVDIKKQDKEALYWILHYEELKKEYIANYTAFNTLNGTQYTGMPHGSGVGNPTLNKGISLLELERQKKWLMTVELMEKTLSEKRLAFLEFRRRAENMKSCEVGRPGWVDYVQCRYAEWHERRYGKGYPPSKRTMHDWMDDIIEVTVRLAIRQGVL